MKRTDFSVDWLFAACAPDTELLPWNAQFTPVRIEIKENLFLVHMI